MLFPDQVKPLIASSNRSVRDHAMRYFADSNSRDPEVVPMFLKAWENDASSDYSAIHTLPALALDRTGMESVIEALKFADRNSGFHLENTLVKAPTEVLRDFGLSAVSKVLSDALTVRIERRLEFAGYDSVDLWQELQSYCKENAGAAYVNKIDHAFVDDLINELGLRNDSPSESEIIEVVGWIQDDSHDWSWLEIFAVDLAGVRRLKSAVPHLVSIFHIDTDYTLERAKLALSRIGDPIALELIHDQWATAERSFRNYASGTFSSIISQDSEDGLLQLVKVEEDATILAWLGMGLCQLFSEQGVEIVAELIRNNRYDRMCVDLVEDAVLVCEALGIDHEDASKWDAHLKHDRREAEERRRLFSVVPEKPKRKTFDLGNEEGEANDTAPATGSAAVLTRGKSKVGRNAPCSCGSGKKYKKCCGRS